MPPSALISSMARPRESRTVCSLIDIAPEVELRNPSLMVSPEVSTQLSAAVVPSSDLLPQAARLSAVRTASAAPPAARPRVRVVNTADLSVGVRVGLCVVCRET
jgi:hypothetical protein